MENTKKESLVAIAKERLALGLGVELSSHFRDADRKLVLIPNTSYSEKNPEKLELLIAYEGYGTVFWDGQRPMTKFFLIQNGFPGAVADQVTDFVLELMGIPKCRERTRIGPPNPEVTMLGVPTATPKRSAKTKQTKEPRVKHASKNKKNATATATRSAAPRTSSAPCPADDWKFAAGVGDRRTA